MIWWVNINQYDLLKRGDDNTTQWKTIFLLEMKNQSDLFKKEDDKLLKRVKGAKAVTSQASLLPSKMSLYVLLLWLLEVGCTNSLLYNTWVYIIFVSHTPTLFVYLCVRIIFVLHTLSFQPKTSLSFLPQLLPGSVTSLTLGQGLIFQYFDQI